MNPIEKFAKIIYLGPQGSTGGKVLGMFAGESRIGLTEEEWFSVRSFQVVKLITPCEWSAEDLSCLIKEGPELPLPDDPVDVVDPEGSEERVPGGSPRRSGPVSPHIMVPPSGPPRAWIDQHGVTPGCYGCKGISERGTARGRVHSKACKQRYEEYLRRRLEEQGNQDEEEDEPPARKRIRGKTTNPPGYDGDDSQPRSGDPGAPVVPSSSAVPSGEGVSGPASGDVEMEPSENSEHGS